MVRITAVHMTPGGYHHQHIADVKWVNPDSGDTGESSRATMVDWLDNKDGKAFVHDNFGNTVWVHTVNATPKYIQTYADGKWTDNLLALPRY